MPDKGGGYYVYFQVENAIFADIQFHKGGLFTAPRTIIKCICWGDHLKYGAKMCFSNILPVADLGLPMGYKANPRECIAQMVADKELRFNKRLEVKHDFGLAKRNNFSKEMHFNNVFENYFSESVVKNIERLLLQDRIEEEEEARLKFEENNPIPE